MLPRAVIVHDLSHARAALAAASALEVPVTLLSAPGAAAYLGAGYFQAMVEAARAEFPSVPAPAVLDCGDKPGLALAALRQGVETVRFSGKQDVEANIADIARKYGGELRTDAPPALDLLDHADAEAACRDWLAG
jgi:fructose/tagatose bisphosphate aldolase